MVKSKNNTRCVKTKQRARPSRSNRTNRTNKPKTYMRPCGEAAEIAGRIAASEGGPLVSYAVGKGAKEVGRSFGRQIKR
jgi:hypothetical protein